MRGEPFQLFLNLSATKQRLNRCRLGDKVNKLEAFAHGSNTRSPFRIIQARAYLTRPPSAQPPSKKQRTMTASQSQVVCDVPTSKLRNIAKELKGRMAANQQPECLVIKNHGIRQPRAIIQDDIMQRPIARSELLFQSR
jgi:hypothetical protein